MNFRNLLLLSALIALCGLSGCPSAPVVVEDPTPRLPFTEIEADLLPGLAAVPFAGSRFAPEIMGPGVAAADLDGDGMLDLIQLIPPNDNQPKEDGRVHLLWQNSEGRFEEHGSDLPAGGWPQAVTLGDVDGDGRLDIALANWGQDRWYRNLGERRFGDPQDLGSPAWSTAAAFCDIDGDGDHDLIVVEYLDYDPEVSCIGPSGQADYCAPQSFPGLEDRLFRNVEGRLVEERAFRFERAHRAEVEGKGLGVACADMTGDGLPDVYIANDREPNHLWVAIAGGGFREEGVLRGVAVNRFGRPEASMGVNLADQDGDGELDLFLTHLGGENNTYYRSMGQDWADRTAASGTASDDFSWTGFGCSWFDADGDGDSDLAVANGRVRRGEPVANASRSAFWDRYSEPDRFYENLGGGRLSPRGTIGTEPRVSRGLLAVDLDFDLDADLIVSHADGSLVLFRNDHTWPAEREPVRLRIEDGAVVSLGARIEWTTDDGRHVHAVHGTEGYQSSDDGTILTFIERADPPRTVQVIWTDGSRESFVWPTPDPASGMRVFRRGLGEGAP